MHTTTTISLFMAMVMIIPAVSEEDSHANHTPSGDLPQSLNQPMIEERDAFRHGQFSVPLDALEIRQIASMA